MVRSSNERSALFSIGCLVWAILAIWLAVYQDMAVLALVGTLFAALFGFGLRDKFASETTASAYSVYNEHGQAIAGGYTSSQLERQLRGGGRQYASATQEEEEKGPAVAAVAASTTNTSNTSSLDRLRRRKEAAAAAERRMQQQTQQ